MGVWGDEKFWLTKIFFPDIIKALTAIKKRIGLKSSLVPHRLGLC